MPYILELETSLSSIWGTLHREYVKADYYLTGIRHSECFFDGDTEVSLVEARDRDDEGMEYTYFSNSAG